MVKQALKIILFIVLFNVIEHFAHEQTGGFTLRRIQFEQKITRGPFIHVPELEQTYHYLGRGNQCFVFLSEDDKYVLKLFKYASSPVPPALTKIPILNTFKPFRPHRYERMLWKRNRDFTGYSLAYNLFREESGLIAAHLEPSGHFTTITFYDKLGCKHSLDLSLAPFILQHKAIPAEEQLKIWNLTGEHEKVKTAFQSLKALLKKRVEIGLSDDDVNFYSNIGFVGEKPIQIDPGHFILGKAENEEEELEGLLQDLKNDL